jgi:mono/diheme cytochrome c family protein
MRARLRIIGIALGAGLAALVAAGMYAVGGWYDVAATRQHTWPIYWLLQTTMRRSVERRAAEVRVPPLADVAMAARGRTLYAEHCVPCHGAPGVAPAPFALGMTPAAANLTHTSRVWRPAELYWVVKHGIKMSAMPAWEFRLPDSDLWAIVAFLQRLPFMTPEQYASQSVAIGSASKTVARVEVKPSAARGKVAIQQYGCGSCHQIPGIVGAHAPVGPPLDGIATRGLIAGMLPNTPEHLTRWLREPRTLNPRSAMPNLGVSDRDARDITAYLYTLE